MANNKHASLLSGGLSATIRETASMRRQEQDEEQAEPSPRRPTETNWQYLVALCALSILICYADRSNISTAVLSMAEELNWDKAYQGIVLSSFFGGYALTQILGGTLADKYGGKLVLAGGVSIWSLFTFLTPAAAAGGTAPLLAARVLLGVGEGVAFPAIHSLIARNVPYANQSTSVGIITAASYAGTAAAFGLSPTIISNYGWEWVFYTFAALALLWLPLWLPVTTKTDSEQAPETVPLQASSSNPEAGVAPRSSSSSAFWALMGRKEVWAICAAQYGQAWGFYGLLNWLPTFFNEFYHVQLADLGSFTLLPYIVQGGVGAASGILADSMLSSGWSIRNVRILLNTAGMLGPAGCLLLAVSPLVGSSAMLASALITTGLGLSALTLGGVSVSHLDIAPKHAGMVFGAGNTAATLAGLVAVPVTGFVLQATDSWSLVFGIMVGHYVLGALAYASWVGDKPLREDDQV